MADLLPTIQLGPHRVTRLIVGANPVIGVSYQGKLLGQFMTDYFSVDNVVDLIERCLDAGLNTWQTSWHDKIDAALTRLRAGGREFHWILLASGTEPEQVKTWSDAARKHGAMAVVHHGGVSDRLYREGQIEQVREFTQRAADLGVLAGVSAHNPDVIRYVEDAGWKPDLFMTCFYRLTRTPQESAEGMREVPLWSEFLPGDPARMCEAIRAVERPCLAFKILAGGRQSEQPEQTKAAFEYAYSNIKPTDGVIVGMFPKFRDEPTENAALARACLAVPA